jgi:NAD+ kinase
MIVFIYGHKTLKEADFAFYDTLFQSLDEASASYYIFQDLHAPLINYQKKYQDIPVFTGHSDLEHIRPDIMITMGGDGTILRAISLIGALETPILGINLGRLGFLASVEKKMIEKTISAYCQGKFYVESRSMLAIAGTKPVFKEFPYALNDFTINKRDTSSMITIHTYIDEMLLNSYWADGIIVSTPTGSTGYSLSCGGPIIFPEAGNFVITPVAPHNLNVRPVVISDKKRITMKVEGRSQNFMSTLDSRYETITSEHTIEIQKAGFYAKFIKLKGQTFMKTIHEKLLWGLDKRN